MAFLLSPSLFWVAIPLLFLIDFIARYALRFHGDSKEREEAKKPSVSHELQHQIYDEVSEEHPDEIVQELEEPPPASASIHHYRFLSEKDSCIFVEQPKTASVRVEESCIQPETEHSYDEENKQAEQSVEEADTKSAFEPVNEPEDSGSALSEAETRLARGGKAVSESSFEKEVISRSEEFSGFDSDSSSSFSDGYSVKDLAVDSDIDCFSSEREFSRYGYEHKSETTMEFIKDIRLSEEARVRLLCDSDAESTTNCKIYTSLKNHLEEGWSENSSSKFEFNKHNSIERDESDGDPCSESRSSSKFELTDWSDEEFFSAKRNGTSMNKPASEEAVNDMKDQENVTERPKDTESKDLPDDDDVEDGLESLWEHQDLIEQLRMELKKAREIGLPTILEESENLNTIVDLKPWKINTKFLREDPMDELHKFYKSYTERMRKFDILNYQKMYAIGFLPLKDPLQSLGTQKPLFPTITSILSQNLTRFGRKSTDDPSERFIKELRCDLETVYVGQTCLSWEFLRWQYEKARELPETDPYRSHQYNQVAGEFQQFQVIVQRFVENESFQGPRLPNYVKNRCALRNLLQVPVIKEDCLKDKLEQQRKSDYVITSEELEDIMEESIRVFWEFIKADKDETPVLLKGLVAPQVDLQEPSDYEFMVNIQNTLQKKEKKLKDILRTRNCLVKKFKKAKEDRSNQELFFSQVDVKLVSRVLKMPKSTTDQLLWCRQKLDNITFTERKIHREPSFLLFPY